VFTSDSSKPSAVATTQSAPKVKPDSAASSLTFDAPAARAKKEEGSKTEFARFKETQAPRPSPSETPRSPAGTTTYGAKPPPIPASGSGSYRSTRYVPDAVTVSTRPVRIYNVFNPYYTRPMVIYRDPYDSFFWWWLLDRSLDDRAWWAYHHRYDMDPARYEALMEHDQQLETRVAQLETQQAPRDANYTPPGLDRDLMYSDGYVEHAYSTRPTTSGRVAFWVFAVPTATGVCGLFIWLIWFKRWQTAT